MTGLPFFPSLKLFVRPELLRARPKFFPERFVKIRIIIEAASHACLNDRDAFTDHIARCRQAFFDYKLKDRQAGVLLKLMREVRFADKADFSQPPERQIFLKVVIDVRDNFVDFFIFCNVFAYHIRRGKICPVQEDHKFAQIDKLQRGAAKFSAFAAVHDLVKNTFQMGDGFPVRPDQLIILLAGVLETVCQAGTVLLKLDEKARSDPDDVSLIRLPGAHLRSVDILIVGVPNDSPERR